MSTHLSQSECLVTFHTSTVASNIYIDTRHSRQRAVVLLLVLTWTKDSSFSRGPFPFAGPTVDVAVVRTYNIAKTLWPFFSLCATNPIY